MCGNADVGLPGERCQPFTDELLSAEDGDRRLQAGICPQVVGRNRHS